MNLKIVCVLLCALALSACSSLVSKRANQNTVSSSLMDFLYPDAKSGQEHTPEIPVLRLPVSVGVAFVPPTRSHRQGLSHNQQIALLDKVKGSFVQYDFIDRIEVIPSTYLHSGKGFATLEQVARLHNVDVMALVSYDQVTQSHENNAALLYWTIVGLYVIPGNENSVQTFVDTAVFDIASRKLLFRAPGLDKLEQRTTAVGIDAALAEKSYESFDRAVADMNRNLDGELGRFRTRVKEENVAKIEHRPGHSGGGAVDPRLMLVMGAFAVGLAAVRRRRQARRF